MNKVSLKRDWFDPEGKMWLARDNPHSTEYGKGDLPSDAVVEEVGEKSPAPVKKTEAGTDKPGKL